MSKFDALIIVDIANKVTRLSKKVCVIDKRNSSAQTRLPQDMGKKQSILSLLQKTPQDADQRKVMRIAFHGDITGLLLHFSTPCVTIDHGRIALCVQVKKAFIRYFT